jgi:hypothetical protein
VTDYADKWVTAALTGTDARLQRGNADFSLYGNDGRVGKYSCGQITILYTLRYFSEYTFTFVQTLSKKEPPS